MNDSQKDNLIQRFDTIANKLNLFSDEEVLRLAKQHAKLQHRRRTTRRVMVAAPLCLLLTLGCVWLIHKQPNQNPNLIAHNSLNKQTTQTPQSVAEVEPLIQTQTPTNTNIKSTTETNTTSEVSATNTESNLQQPTVSPQCGIIECHDWCDNQEILAELNYILETSYKV